MHFEIRTATDADLPAAMKLLRAASLPTEDLVANHVELVAEDTAGTLGVIGIEPFGDVALLRSLAVSSRGRGAGVGRSLVEALEAAAYDRGIRELWLLTIDADGFFLRLGYSMQDRQRAPVAIQKSNEFSNLCPADAVLMSKRLP